MCGRVKNTNTWKKNHPKIKVIEYYASARSPYIAYEGELNEVTFTAVLHVLLCTVASESRGALQLDKPPSECTLVSK